MLQLSAILRAPNRSLCMATKNAESDGPYRTLRFKVHRIRRDFQNVLVHADVKKLIATANELLSNPKVRKTPSFWDIYTKRVILTAHSLSAIEVAKILASFDQHKQVGGVYSVLGARLTRRIGHHNAAATVTLLDILSRRLKKNAFPELFATVCSHVPNIMFQLRPVDMVQILHSLHSARAYSPQTCERFAQKLIGTMHTLDATHLAYLSALLALHGHKDAEIYKSIERCAVKLHRDFDAQLLERLFWGFYKFPIKCDDLIEALSQELPTVLLRFSRSGISVLRDLLDKSDRPFGTLRNSVDRVAKTDLC